MAAGRDPGRRLHKAGWGVVVVALCCLPAPAAQECEARTQCEVHPLGPAPAPGTATVLCRSRAVPRVPVLRGLGWGTSTGSSLGSQDGALQPHTQGLQLLWSRGAQRTQPLLPLGHPWTVLVELWLHSGLSSPPCTPDGSDLGCSSNGGHPHSSHPRNPCTEPPMKYSACGAQLLPC